MPIRPGCPLRQGRGFQRYYRLHARVPAMLTPFPASPAMETVSAFTGRVAATVCDVSGELDGIGLRDNMRTAPMMPLPSSDEEMTLQLPGPSLPVL